MSLIFNGTDVKSASFNGTSLNRIYYQPKDGACTLVWQKGDLYTVSFSVTEDSYPGVADTRSNTKSGELFCGQNGFPLMRDLVLGQSNLDWWRTYMYNYDRYGCNWLVPKLNMPDINKAVSVSATVSGPNPVYMKTDISLACLVIKDSCYPTVTFGSDKVTTTNCFVELSSGNVALAGICLFETSVRTGCIRNSGSCPATTSCLLPYTENVANATITLCANGKEFQYPFECVLQCKTIQFYA